MEGRGRERERQKKGHECLMAAAGAIRVRGERGGRRKEKRGGGGGQPPLVAIRTRSSFCDNPKQTK